MTTGHSHNYLWFAGLSVQDLRRLRKSVRRIQMKHYPERHITNDEADKIIVAIGPVSALNQLKHQIDSHELDAKKFSFPTLPKRADPALKRRRAMASADYVKLVS
ncbi:MAG: hypothetical protein ABGY96_27435 [bacterium]